MLTIFWPRPKYAEFTSCSTLAHTAASISMTLANDDASDFGSAASRASSVYVDGTAGMRSSLPTSAVSAGFCMSLCSACVCSMTARSVSPSQGLCRN